MKSMLYVGATLMIGASVYGFVDYQKSSHRKEFTRMYSGDKKTDPVPVTREEKNVTAPEKTVTVKSKPARVTRNSAKTEITADPVKPIATEDKMTVSKTTLPEKSTVTVAPATENTLVKTVKKKRKFSSKLFSRAPLRDEEELPPVKEETKKTDAKEKE